MLHILAAVLPVFAVVAVGYAVAWNEFARETLGPWLARAVFTVLLPLLVFRTLATVEIPDQSPWALWATYFTGAAIAWGLAHALARISLGRDIKTATAIGFGGAYSNLLLLGLSLTYQLYGDAGAVPLFILLLVHLPLMLFVATLQLEWASARKAGPLGPIVVKVARGSFGNPIMLALLAGLIYRQTGIGLAPGLNDVLKVVGQIAVPGALFSMGVSLKAYGARDEVPASAVIILVKLVAHPLLVWLLATFVFGLSPLWVTVATLAAASPTGVNVYLFAARYRVAIGAVSGAIAFGTALSALTITLALLLGLFEPPLR